MSMIVHSGVHSQYKKDNGFMLVPSVLFSDNGIPGCELLCTKLLFVCTFTSTVDYCLLFFLLVNHVSMLSQIVFLKNVMLQKKKKRLMISNIMHLMNKPCLPVWSGKTHIHDYCNMFKSSDAKITVRIQQGHQCSCLAMNWNF